jgi:hypothetical protein
LITARDNGVPPCSMSVSSSSFVKTGNGASMIRERFPASDPDYHVVERLKALDVRR